MDYLSIVEIWKYLRWLPKFILRRVFTKDRLSDLVLIDVQPRHESVRADLGEISSYAIWFQIINMTPFDIELDRAEIEFMCEMQIESMYLSSSTSCFIYFFFPLFSSPA